MEGMEGKEIFLDIALSQIPRILGFLDTCPDSKTYGCFDRNYWHYKTIDFSNARFQEAALVLSLIYSLDSAENRFYNSAKIKTWAMAAIAFWAKNRHGDGSTDESYPFERHFCSTAFSCYAVTESLLLLKEIKDVKLGRIGNFLAQHNNMDVANQMASAAAALYNLYLLEEKQIYKVVFEHKLKLLFEMQSKEGYFSEYGGFDIGYDSVTLSFLGVLYKKTGRDDIRNSALLCIKNLERFVDDTGYFNSEAMSRKTQFLYPYGFAVFDSDILKRIKNGLEKSVLLNPGWMDDRYCVPLTENYLLTVL